MHETVNGFLSGFSAKRCVRGVFNKKIQSLTRNPNLTQQVEIVKYHELFNFGRGQIFGEERHIQLLQTKNAIDQINTREMTAVEKMAMYALKCREIKTPYTVQCNSLTGQLYKISAIEFTKKILYQKNAFETLKDFANKE